MRAFFIEVLKYVFSVVISGVAVAVVIAMIKFAMFLWRVIDF